MHTYKCKHTYTNIPPTHIYIYIWTLHIYTYIHTHTYIYTHTHIYIHIRMRTHTYTYLHAYTHAHTHIHIKNIYICITIYILKKEPKGETYIYIISPPCDQCKRASKNMGYADATVTKGRCKRTFYCLWLQLHV